METKLEKVLTETAARPETVGALVANRQGLCLVAKGDINPNVSGIGMAIAQQVAKLEPNNTVPATICLYSGNKRCYIKNDGKITTVIFKQLSAASTTAAAAAAGASN